MQNKNYKIWQRTLAFILLFNHSFLSCTCKRSPIAPSQQQNEPSNRQQNPPLTRYTPPPAPTVPEAIAREKVAINELEDESEDESAKEVNAPVQPIVLTPFPEDLLSSDESEDSDDEEEAYQEESDEVEERQEQASEREGIDGVGDKSIPSHEEPQDSKAPSISSMERIQGQTGSLGETNPQPDIPILLNETIDSPKHQPSKPSILPTSQSTSQIKRDKQRTSRYKPSKEELSIPADVQSQQQLSRQQREAKQLKKKQLPLSQGPVFKTTEGYSIQFTDGTATQAILVDSQPPFHRTLQLPVKKQDPSINLETLSQENNIAQPYHLHTVLPEQDPNRKGFIVIAKNNKALLGGMPKKGQSSNPKGNSNPKPQKQTNSKPQIVRGRNKKGEVFEYDPTCCVGPDGCKNSGCAGHAKRVYESKKYRDRDQGNPQSYKEPEPTEREKDRIAHEAVMDSLFKEIDKSAAIEFQKEALKKQQKEESKKQEKVAKEQRNVETRKTKIEGLIKKCQAVASGEYKGEAKFSVGFLAKNVRFMRNRLVDINKAIARDRLKKGFNLRTQKNIRDCLKDLAKLSRKLQKASDEISYFLSHPEENWRWVGNEKIPYYTQEDLAKIQKNIEELSTIKTEVGDLIIRQGESPAAYEPKPHQPKPVEEKAAWHHLEHVFSQVSSAPVVLEDLKKQADELLDQLAKQPNLREKLLPKATQLGEQLNKFHQVVASKASSLTAIYNGSDPLNTTKLPIEQVISHYSSLDTIRYIARDCLYKVEEGFKIEIPDQTIYIEHCTGQIFRNYFHRLIKQLKPGSKLMESLPAGTTLPPTPQEQAKLLLEQGINHTNYAKGISENIRIFATPQTPAYEATLSMLRYLIEKKQQGKPDIGLLKPLIQSPKIRTKEEAEAAVHDYLKVGIMGVLPEPIKKQSAQRLLSQVEELKKEIKKKYRITNHLYLTEELGGAGMSHLLGQLEIHKKDLHTLRNLREQLITYSPQLTREEYLACGLKMKDPSKSKSIESSDDKDNQDKDGSDEDDNDDPLIIDEGVELAADTDEEDSYPDLILADDQPIKNNSLQPAAKASKSKAQTYSPANNRNYIPAKKVEKDEFLAYKLAKPISKGTTLGAPKPFPAIIKGQDVGASKPPIGASKGTTLGVPKPFPAIIKEEDVGASKPPTGASKGTTLGAPKPFPAIIKGINIETSKPSPRLSKGTTLGAPTKKQAEEKTPLEQPEQQTSETTFVEKAIEVTAKVADFILPGGLESWKAAAEGLLHGERDVVAVSDFKSTDEAIGAMHAYFQKSTDPKAIADRQEGLYVLTHIELLKRAKKYSYRSSREAVLTDLSPEGAKLLDEKAIIYANELLLLRDARRELKRYLKPTEQELADCHVRVIYLSPDEAITDSSDDELLYSRAGIAQQKEAAAGLAKIASDVATQKASKLLPKQPYISLASKGAKPRLSAYEIALAGGEHKGFLVNVCKLPTSLLQKSIRSLEANILKHKNLVKNPEKYMKEYKKGDWSSLPQKQKEALVNSRWPNEIQKFQDQVNILQGIIKSRQ